MKSLNLSKHIGSIDSRLVDEADLFAGKNKSRYVVRKLAVGLAAAVAAVSLATAALAAAGIIDYKSIYDSVIKSVFDSEQAAPYLQTGENITVQMSEGDIEVKLISAFTDPLDHGGLYFELEMTDMTGGRLSDSFVLIERYKLDNNTEYEHGYRLLNQSGTNTVQIIDKNTVKSGFNTWHLFNVNGEVRVCFNIILSDIRYYEMEPTAFTAGALIDSDTTVLLAGENSHEIIGTSLQEKTLTITHRDLYGSLFEGWSLGLMKPDGDIIWGNRDSYQSGMPRQTRLNIGDLDPDVLTLVWSGHLAKHVITGDWDFIIHMDNDTAPEIKIFTGEYEGLRIEVIVGATSVRVRIYDAPDIDAAKEIVFNDCPLVLHITDGRIIETIKSGAEGGTDVIGISYIMPFIDPEEVVSVTFRGTEISG